MFYRLEKKNRQPFHPRVVRSFRTAQLLLFTFHYTSWHPEVMIDEGILHFIYEVLHFCMHNSNEISAVATINRHATISYVSTVELSSVLVSHHSAERMHIASRAGVQWEGSATDKTTAIWTISHALLRMYPIPSHPIPSNPIIPSRPTPSSTVLFNSSEENTLLLIVLNLLQMTQITQIIQISNGHTRTIQPDSVNRIQYRLSA